MGGLHDRKKVFKMNIIKLNDEIHKEIYILTKIEYSKLMYREISATGRKMAFLPGKGTTLFFENKHYFIIDDKKPLKAFAIWRNHKVIGYCYLTEETAERANADKEAFFYFGFDEVTEKANN